jgi:hypothetical protein
LIAEYAAGRAIDLASSPFKAKAAFWSRPTDDGRCQSLADNARAATVDLTCRVFTKPQPIALQTWHIRLSATGAQAICEAPKSGSRSIERLLQLIHEWRNSDGPEDRPFGIKRSATRDGSRPSYGSA